MKFSKKFVININKKLTANGSFSLHLLFLDIEILLLTRQKKYCFWQFFFAILDHFEEKGTLVHYLRKSILVYPLSSAKGHFHIKDDADT